jgi:hypothetical protein
VAHAAEQELASCLRQAGTGRPRHGQLAALHEAARSSIAAERFDVALSVKVRALVRQIRVLDHAITELEQVSVAAFAKLGHAPSHFPVGSAVALAALVAEAGDPQSLSVRQRVRGPVRLVPGRHAERRVQGGSSAPIQSR